MNKLMVLSAVAALMLGGSACAADDPTVQVKASPYKLAPAEFDQFVTYGYRLDDGNFIRFAQTGRKYWARLNNGSRIELYPVQPGAFMTASGSRIEFQEGGETVVIDNYERMPLAVAPHGTDVRVTAAR